MSHVPGYDEDDAHLTVQPWPGHRENGPVRHRSPNKPRRRRRIVTTAVAIIAVAAIASGVALYNRSADPAAHAGPLPVNLPRTPGSYLGVFVNDLTPLYEAGTPAVNTPR